MLTLLSSNNDIIYTRKYCNITISAAWQCDILSFVNSCQKDIPVSEEETNLKILTKYTFYKTYRVKECYFAEVQHPIESHPKHVLQKWKTEKD